MNLTATLCQTQSPAFITIYKQNNNKIVKKAGNRVRQIVAVKFIAFNRIRYKNNYNHLLQHKTMALIRNIYKASSGSD